MPLVSRLDHESKALESLYLQDERYYHVEMATLGQSLAQYKLIIHILHLVLKVIVGFLFDTVNTRLVVSLGCVLLVTCTVLFPWG